MAAHAAVARRECAYALGSGLTASISGRMSSLWILIGQDGTGKVWTGQLYARLLIH